METNTKTNITKILPKKISHYINGEFTDSSDQTLQIITVTNPTTEEKICEFIEAGPNEINLAYESSVKAQVLWEKMPLDVKVKLFMDLANIIESQIEELALIESYDNGKSIKESQLDILEVIRVIRFYGGFIDKIFGTTISANDEFNIEARRIPYGVVACISPWNYPLLMAAWKIVPALCAGNAVILKPSEETPLTVLKFCEIFGQLDFPKGLFNVVNGRGPTTGNLLTTHPKIAKVSFTGSTIAGRQIMKASSESNLKAISLELVGKSPLIIFDDADLENAIEWVIDGAFFNSSQSCICASRIFIHEKIYEKFTKMIEEKTKDLIIGRFDEEDVKIGPLINKRQYERYFTFLDIAEKEKLQLLCGGKSLKSEFPKGYFVEPTVFVNVPDDSRLSQEEIFAPIISVLTPFKTAKEALDRANNSPYGLSSGVFTTDMAKAEYFVRNLQSGSVNVNCYNLSPYNAPFGGLKQSGFGRDNGIDGIMKYTTLKTVIYFNDFSELE
jgi:acyl-CoA reductase-like NAD-dependent aldehyde dehydrogenase